MANDALENLSFESRIYEPTKEFASNANAQKSGKSHPHSILIHISRSPLEICQLILFY